MKTKLVRIGNSQGVRLPKAFIEDAHLAGDIDVSLEGGAVVIRGSAPHPRAGWAESFDALGASDDAEFVDDFVATEFDETEWQWE